MQQIADWLEKLGMSEYTERFTENGIDISVLRDSTDQDLKDIGVLLGHRRKILRAIGELGSAAPLTTEPAVGTEPKAQDTAERRQVTVMFSDLVGSTALSARMDPEDLRKWRRFGHDIGFGIGIAHGFATLGTIALRAASIMRLSVRCPTLLLGFATKPRLDKYSSVLGC